MYMYMYIHIYICMYVCVCVCMFVYYFRLLDRVVLIHVPNRKSMTDRASQSTLWNQRFSKILSHVSSTVGDIVRIGQWLHSTDRGNFRLSSNHKRGIRKFCEAQ